MPLSGSGNQRVPWLPTITARYRVQDHWSTYAQFAEGSVIPPSAVFDVPGGNVLTPQKPTLAKNYQVGSVIKYNRWTFDADLYYVHFQNGFDSCAGPHRAGKPPVTRRAIRFELSGELCVDAELGLVYDQQARDAHRFRSGQVAIDHKEVGHRNGGEHYEQARQVRNDRLGHPTQIRAV